MTTKLNQRLNALKEIGGTKSLRVLPRELRAQAIASLMLEKPAKPQAAKSAALPAFSSAVERGEAFRAKKLAGRFSLPEEKCSEIVSSKMKELRAEETKESAELARDFEIVFGMGKDAEERFTAEMRDDLEYAKQKLRIDYTFADNHFRKIIKDQQERGIDVNIEEAAAWLAVSFIRRRHLEQGLGIVKEFLLNDGELTGPQKILLEDELKKVLPICGEGYLEKISDFSKKQGTYPLLRDAVMGMTAGLDFTKLENVERVFSLSRIFGIRGLSEDMGTYLANAYMGKAETHPEKFMNDYLRAARAAVFAGLDELMDEAIDKYLALAESPGSADPELMENAMQAALEFSRIDTARELGEKATLLYLAQGNLEKAEEMANESGNSVLRYQIARVRERISP